MKKGIEVVEKTTKYNRHVTIIKFNGFSISEKDKKEIARELKRRLGTGGTVKNGEVILQGRHKQRVMSLLEPLLEKYT